jgi:hypothetical protein
VKSATTSRTRGVVSCSVARWCPSLQVEQVTAAIDLITAADAGQWSLRNVEMDQ